jgi:hypothetical protein
MSYSASHYEDGRYTSALTLNQSLFITRERSSTLADGVVSLFDDGRWSMAGELSGLRYTKPIKIPELVVPFATDYYIPFFHALRGELSLTTAGSVQQGLMPTMQVLPQARLHFLDPQRGVWLGGGFARTFDGDEWRTTLLGDVGGWFRRGGTVVSASFHPQQLQNGDLMNDLSATFDKTLGGLTLSAAAGWRTGQAERVDLGWVSVGATFAINRRLLATASFGNYPADLMQRLPAAQFMALSIRLPSRSVFPRRDDKLTTVVQPTPTADGVILRIATTDTAKAAKVVRVRAPASDRVELMADFTDWVAVPLVRTPEGFWEVTLPVTRGSHRLNVRLDGGEWVVPTNVARVTDEFGGVVGLVLVR